MDSLQLDFRGNNLNLFQKFNRLQKIALWVSLLALVLWMLLGFDSAMGQITMFIYATPQYLGGQITLNQWIQIFFDNYGKEMHFSAFVIYGLCFYFLSKNLEKNGIFQSKNIAFSSGLTFLSIGLFEFYWMICYATFQNQGWVITLRLPQLRIIFQNLAFVSVGALTLLYMYCEHYERLYRLRLDWKALSLVGLTIASAVVWIYYPFPVERFTVTYEDGTTWSNTNLFPQTLYTIDINPNDNVNAGVWFWMENDLIHLWNTVVKVLFTLSIFYIGYVKCNFQKRNFQL